MTRIHLSPPDVGEREREMLLEAFDSGWIAPLGPHVDAFEKEVAARVGVSHAAALSSGTAALHLALQILGVGEGDEVLVPTLTFAATANAVRYLGATPVFVDADAATWTMDPARVAEALEDAVARTGRPPAACITVDLYGQCADHDPIAEACARYEVPVIEDAAEALGATYKGRAAGALGRVGVLSFNGNKILTTSGGGMLLSDDPAIAARAVHLATQAREPAPWYEHEDVGYNYRLSNLLAAVGRAQLESLDAKVEARRAHNGAYREALRDLPGVTFMPEAPYGKCTFWLTCVTVDPDALGSDRERIREHLAALDIEARPVWKPMHMQPVWAGRRCVGGAVAEDLFARGLCLPSGSSLSEADRARVVAGFREAVGR